ncbi:MAG: hypothetical protein IID05_03295, partial [Gemmatimonadetes bacterium]|nr:hypothetical protein [Gemmatimonadota bacterium]
GMLGNKRLQVFPIREMKFAQVPEEEPKIATYKAKWDEAYRKKWGIRNQFVGSLANGTAEKIEKISKRIYRLLFMRGYGRLDLRLTAEGEVFFIEANPNPTREEMAHALSGNLCRCGDYNKILDSAMRAAEYARRRA